MVLLAAACCWVLLDTLNSTGYDNLCINRPTVGCESNYPEILSTQPVLEHFVINPANLTLYKTLTLKGWVEMLDNYSRWMLDAICFVFQVHSGWCGSGNIISVESYDYDSLLKSLAVR